MEYDEDPPAATHGWACHLCQWHSRSISRQLMDLNTLIAHGVRNHYIQDSQITEFVNDAHFEDRSQQQPIPTGPSQFVSYATLPLAAGVGSLTMPRYDQRDQQFMTNPPALNQTFDLVEITNQPYQNFYQRSYQNTYQKTFQNSYHGPYETTKTFENAGCEEFNEDGKTGGFDYTVNKIHNTFESEEQQTDTRENFFVQQFRANAGHTQQAHSVNFEPACQEQTVEQGVRCGQKSRFEGETTTRDEMRHFE